MKKVIVSVLSALVIVAAVWAAVPTIHTRLKPGEAWHKSKFGFKFVYASKLHVAEHDNKTGKAVSVMMLNYDPNFEVYLKTGKNAKNMAEEVASRAKKAGLQVTRATIRTPLGTGFLVTMIHRFEGTLRENRSLYIQFGKDVLWVLATRGTSDGKRPTEASFGDWTRCVQTITRMQRGGK